MMTLTLLRHASAQQGRPDHRRALSQVGIAEAENIGRSLSGHISPTLVTASDAERATTTAQLVIESAGWEVTPTLESMLYQAASWDVIGLIATTPPAHTSILVVGHQPTMSQTVQQLTGKRMDVAPATGIVIDMEMHTWSELTTATGAVRAVIIG